MAEAKPVNTADLELIHANIAKAMAETYKLGAETMKLGAETTKIQAESRYYLMVALGAIIVAGIGSTAAVIAGIIKLAF